MNIPEHIKEQIETHSTWNDHCECYQEAAEFGYSLSLKELESYKQMYHDACETGRKEMERVDGLMKELEARDARIKELEARIYKMMNPLNE
jgi:hypothetical protein